MRFREIKRYVKYLIEEALERLGYPIVEFSIDEPPSKEFGDLYTNVAFLLSKRLKRKPFDIAKDITNVIESNEMIDRVYAHQAGYINFIFNSLNFVNEVLREGIKCNIDIGKNVRVLIEHTSVNPNKALHMGHVRNLVIGDALYRILKFTKHDVYVLNYVDDSGLQVADIIVGFYFLKMPLESNKKFDHYCGDDVYVQVNRLYEQDESLLEKRRIVLKSMEDYDSSIARFAREITDRVLREQLKTCWRLKARYDCLNFESQIIKSRLWSIIKDRLLKEGIAKIDDDENSKYYKCLIVKGGIEGEEKVLERSDGTATYIAKDIPYAAWKLGLIDDPFGYVEYANQFDDTILYATVLDNKNDMSFSNAEKAITVIDVRQTRLQRIISNILSALGNDKPYIHLGYEVVTLSADAAKQLGIDTKDKKFVHMKGREGSYINADIMLDRLHSKAYEEAKSRNPDLAKEELDRIAESIAIAAIRYNMLKYDLDKSIIFDIDEALRLQGDTGPYLQYSYARGCRILEKAKPKHAYYRSVREEEVALAKEISKLDLVIEDAAINLDPKVIARYAYKLADLFNVFYEHVQVLNSEEQDARLSLVEAFLKSMEILLNLLGIEPLNRM